MPSEIIKVHGRCGKELEFKLWKQGGSVKCSGYGAINHYPKPDELQIYFIISDLCEGCSMIVDGEQR